MRKLGNSQINIAKIHKENANDYVDGNNNTGHAVLNSSQIMVVFTGCGWWKAPKKVESCEKDIVRGIKIMAEPIINAPHQILKVRS